MPLLFSYGTLQDREIQIAIFGRELKGRADALPGYVRRKVNIGDTQFYDASPDPEKSVSGMVFEVTNEELTAADEYERDADYVRIEAPLSSGVRAWVYVRGR